MTAVAALPDHGTTLPFSEESERAVLAAILLDSERHLPPTAERLCAEDFYLGRHQRLFQAMLGLQEEGVAIDLRTLQARLEQQNVLNEVGGLAYIATLEVDLPDLGGVAEYVDIVKERSLRRSLLDICTRMYRNCRDGGLDGRAALDHAERSLGNLRETESVGTRARTVELISAAEIAPERTERCWGGRIVLGELGLIVGPPGVGKGSIVMDLTAQITRGTLDGELYGTPSSVVIASAEDSPSHTIVPRLMAAGADRERVHIVRVMADGAEDGLILPDDVAALAALVEEVRAVLVVIDPIAAHLSGRVDSHKDASIRKALAPLSRMGHETGAAVEAVAHTNKAAGGDWVRRVGGSVGLSAAARNVLIVADDPEGEDRVVVHCKSNTGVYGPTLRYRIEGREIEIQGQTIATCGVAWLGEAEGITAADVLAETEPVERTERDEAAAWLVACLEDHGGEANAGECIKDAERDGISKRTLQRARKPAGVTSQRSSEGWVWILQDAKSSRHLSRGTLAPSSKHRASEDIEGARYLQDAKVPACQTEDEVAPCRQVVDL